MRSMLFVVASFAVTIFCWGVYGVVLHWGQEGMAEEGLKLARLRPFICVGLSYFAIGVVAPLFVLFTKGEQGAWSMRGTVMSLVAGALGAIGALGIILAFTFGGKPVYVMPLVFGGAPVVNSFLTIYWTKKFKEIGPMFLAGLMMVLMGAVTVLISKPSTKPAVEKTTLEKPTAEASAEAERPKIAQKATHFGLQLLSIATVVVCWGAYGPTLHKGQAAMQNSRLRPLLCVGLAYFAIAVAVPLVILQVSPESSSFFGSGRAWGGTVWSLAAGAAGAVGALGIILAFNFGGKPVYVMPLVFGGAPVVNTLVSAFEKGLLGNLPSAFIAGLMLVIAGAAIVLVFAPKGGPPKTTSMTQPEPEPGPAPADAASEASSGEA